jgi:hypothetical protein
MRRNDDGREQVGISYQLDSGMRRNDDSREPYFIKKTSCFYNLFFLHFEILPQVHPFYCVVGGDFLGGAVF